MNDRLARFVRRTGAQNQFDRKGDSVLWLQQGLDLDAFAFNVCGHDNPPPRATDVERVVLQVISPQPNLVSNDITHGRKKKAGSS
jgi:hypothetical protein